MTCAGLYGLTVTVAAGDVGVNGDLRVFAGLRDDPLFLDLDAINQVPTLGIGAFAPPGREFFAAPTYWPSSWA